ncbi:MAG TPA: NAD(P)H-hydrate epimerase, partial [Chromatiaceae bacterium]|nr:NAD(P)H-hydrate epimerase [Chromatiaceae bacterium]
MTDHTPMPRSFHLPQALYRAEQVRELDRLATEEYGIPGEVLMHRAGDFAWETVQRRWPKAERLVVLVGTGNNGGDGFVLARLALQSGKKVRVLQLGERERIRGDARTHALKYAALSGEWRPFEGRLPENADLLVDAIFGTGLEREVRGTWADAITGMNQSRAPVLALDLPSGLHAVSGAILGVATRAEATATFIALKQGMFTGEGPACCGEIFFDALAVPARLYGHLVLSARRLDWARQRELLQPRIRTAHKGHFGHVLVVGGDYGFGGAARLAAEAALRTGAGWVSLATRKEHLAAVLATRPEIMA